VPSVITKVPRRKHARDDSLRAEEKIGCRLTLNPSAREALCAMADGDGRYLLNLVEVIINADLSITLDSEELCKICGKRSPI
jgi:putative ATPase